MSSIPRSYIDDIRRIAQSVLNQLESLKVRNIYGLEEVNGVAWTGGGVSGTQKIFFPVLRGAVATLTYDGDFAVWNFPASTLCNARGTIHIPPDFSSGAKIYGVIIPKGTGTGYADFLIDYGAIGQAPTAHAASGGGDVSMTSNVLVKTSEISLSSASIGDYVGVRMQSSTGRAIEYNLIGFILEYES